MGRVSQCGRGGRRKGIKGRGRVGVGSGAGRGGGEVGGRRPMQALVGERCRPGGFLNRFGEEVWLGVPLEQVRMGKGERDERRNYLRCRSSGGRGREKRMCCRLKLL